MPLSSQIEEDVLVAPISLRMGLPSTPEHMKPWLSWLSQSGLRLAVADNRAKHAFAFSSTWHQHLREKQDVSILWISWSLRDSLRAARDLDFGWLVQLIPTWRGSVTDWAAELAPRPVHKPAEQVQHLVSWAEKLVQVRHPGLVRQLVREVQQCQGELAFWYRGENTPLSLDRSAFKNKNSCLDHNTRTSYGCPPLAW